MTPATLNLSLTRGITFGPIEFLFCSEIKGNVTVDPLTDVFTLVDHGLSPGDRIRFRNTGGALPTPLIAATTYYANPLDGDTFEVNDVSGPVDITDAGSGTQELLIPADLTDWIPYAEVKTDPESTSVILDLAPIISQPDIGEVTIPAIQDEQTILLPSGSGGKLKCKWDLIFQVPTGERIGPYIAGSFLIKSIITEPAEP
jgi:hypothetical protein